MLGHHPTAKRHLNLNGVSLAGRCWPAYVVFGSSLSSSTKKKTVVKGGPPQAKLTGSAQDTLTRLNHELTYNVHVQVN